MYYLIGIKGTGMSALAGILKDLGYEVKGSDNDNHYFTEEGLKKKTSKFYRMILKTSKKECISSKEVRLKTIIPKFKEL